MKNRKYFPAIYWNFGCGELFSCLLTKDKPHARLSGYINMHNFHHWVEKKTHEPHQWPVLSWQCFALTPFGVISTSFYADDEGITVYSTLCLKTKMFLIFLASALSWSCVDPLNKCWSSVACKVPDLFTCRYFCRRHLKRKFRRVAEHCRKLTVMMRWVMGYLHSTVQQRVFWKVLHFVQKFKRKKAIFQLFVFQQSVSQLHFTRIANKID